MEGWAKTHRRGQRVFHLPSAVFLLIFYYIIFKHCICMNANNNGIASVFTLLKDEVISQQLIQLWYLELISHRDHTIFGVTCIQVPIRLSKCSNEPACKYLLVFSDALENAKTFSLSVNFEDKKFWSTIGPKNIARIRILMGFFIRVNKTYFTFATVSLKSPKFDPYLSSNVH